MIIDQFRSSSWRQIAAAVALCVSSTSKELVEPTTLSSKTKVEAPEFTEKGFYLPQVYSERVSLLDDFRKNIESMLDPKYQLENLEVEIKNYSVDIKIQIKGEDAITLKLKGNERNYEELVQEALEKYTKTSESKNPITISTDPIEDNDHQINFPQEIDSLSELESVENLSINIANFNSYELELALKKLQDLDNAQGKINLKLKNFEDHEKAFFRIIADFTEILDECPSPDNTENHLTQRAISLNPELQLQFESFYGNVPELLAILNPTLKSLSEKQTKLLDLYILNKLGIDSFDAIKKDVDSILKVRKGTKVPEAAMTQVREQLIKAFDFNDDQRISLGDNLVLSRFFEIFNESGYERGDFGGLKVQELLFNLIPEFETGFELMSENKRTLNKVFCDGKRSISIINDDQNGLTRLQASAIASTGLAFDFSWLDKVISSRSADDFRRDKLEKQDEKLYRNLKDSLTKLHDIFYEIYRDNVRLPEARDQKRRLDECLRINNVNKKLEEFKQGRLKEVFNEFDEKYALAFTKNQNEITSLFELMIDDLEVYIKLLETYPDVVQAYKKHRLQAHEKDHRLKKISTITKNQRIKKDQNLVEDILNNAKHTLQKLKILYDTKLSNLPSERGHDSFFYDGLNGHKVVLKAVDISKLKTSSRYTKELRKYDMAQDVFEKYDKIFNLTTINQYGSRQASSVPRVYVGTDNLGRRFLKLELPREEIMRMDLPSLCQALNDFAKKEACQYVYLDTPDLNSGYERIQFAKSRINLDTRYFDLPVTYNLSVLFGEDDPAIQRKTPFADGIFADNPKKYGVEEIFFTQDEHEKAFLNYLNNENIDRFFENIENFKTDSEQLKIVQELLKSIHESRFEKLNRAQYLGLVRFAEKVALAYPNQEINEEMMNLFGMFYIMSIYNDHSINELDRAIDYKVAVAQKIIPEDKALSKTINEWAQESMIITRGNLDADKLSDRFIPQYPNIKSQRQIGTITKGALINLSQAAQALNPKAKAPKKAKKVKEEKFEPELTKDGFKVFVAATKKGSSYSVLRANYEYHWNPDCDALAKKREKDLPVDELMSEDFQFEDGEPDKSQSYGKVKACSKCKPPKPSEFAKYRK